MNEIENSTVSRRLFPIEVIDIGDSQIAVTVEGVRLVDGVETNLMETRPGGGVPVEVDNVYFERQGLQTLDRQLDDGALGGIVDARDRIIPDLAEEINILARSIIQEVNRIHSAAAGTAGYTTLTSDFNIPSGAQEPDTEITLDDIFNNPNLSSVTPLSQYPFGIQNGEFTIRVADEDNETRGTFSVSVDVTDSL